MSEVRITIPGRIGGKGRARFSRQTRTAYTPEKTRATEAMLRQIAALHMRSKALLQGPLEVMIEVNQIPPDSWSQRKKAEARWITGKPDADNVIKSLDAFNGIVWRDDSQIARLFFERRYVQNEGERVEIVVRELSNAAETKIKRIPNAPIVTYSGDEAA